MTVRSDMSNCILKNCTLNTPCRLGLIVFSQSTTRLFNSVYDGLIKTQSAHNAAATLQSKCNLVTLLRKYSAMLQQHCICNELRSCMLK